ncbi:ATP-binding protein [Pseudomonas sp. ADAK2]|uniref:AAA family ATPase n=1 Tax=unclassified Pseudomonas TaxID=196821 RepID=UPI001463ED62|nr:MULTISPECIES: ATP-binding protein [unclassified Pseudomonas]QJI42160.1 ATP-binding protein [Pseudomonas sp. ADAK7]QJI48463.1 ATP-binding protein [Pseudomonas sp. ADAK2]
MLIEFSVSNYRSFRERQTFSMVATPRLSKKRNVFKPAVDGEKFPNLLKVAAIYGPNASGKSSLIHAMGIMGRLIATTPLTNDQSLPVSPFRFDPELKDKPSYFEYNFIRKGVRYNFVLGLTSERIIEEKLTSYPKGKESLLYDRKFTSGGEQYVFGVGFEGGKEVHSAWRRLTSPKALFIAQAVNNSSEELSQLKEPFGWFQTGLSIIGHDDLGTWSKASIRFLKMASDYTEELKDFLKEIDIPISSIRLDDNGDDHEEKGRSLTIQEFFAAAKKDKIILTHISGLGSAEFDFSEESGGTKNLIGFWLPWFMLRLAGGEGVLAVDELDSSLHPELVADLIVKHLDSGLDAQLIFTTHDTHLMNTKTLRRDQFWITDRDANGATNLFSIHDFEGREGEDVEKRYFEGRYFGLPLIRRR